MREELSSSWREYRSQIEKRLEDMDSWSRLIEADNLSASTRLGHKFGCYLNAHYG